MYGGQAGIQTDYNCPYDYFFIIGGDGVIKWRGSWRQANVEAALDAAIAELDAAPVPGVSRPGFELLANYPNPFNPTTRIPYQLGREPGLVEVRLDILDFGGRLVKTLVHTQQAAGHRYEVVWDGTNERGHLMASGIYLSRLQANGVPQTRFLTLVK